LDPEGDLGPVVISCRDRSEKERLAAMGQSLIGWYLMPIWTSLIVTLLLTAVIVKFAGRPSPTVFGLMFVTVFATTSGVLYWQLLRRPRKPSLVLHEQGFRFKKNVVRFDELTSIRFGGQFSSLASAALKVDRWLGEMNEAAAELVEKGRQGSVTLVFTTGQTKSLDGMLIRPQPDDLKLFLERLRSIRPRLLEDPPAPAPDLGDLRFKMTQL
jgi:hypothetical protein